jgi:transposase-like protein
LLAWPLVNRRDPLDEIYAAVLIDAIVVKIRDGQVANRPVYAAIGVTLHGRKDVADHCPQPLTAVVTGADPP